MEVWIILAIISILLIILLFILKNFKWLIKEFRIICEQPSGYFKTGQIIILLFTISVFMILLIYNLKYGKQVSTLDIFLTITVGFMGTIIGLFYGGKATYYISIQRKNAIHDLANKSVKLADEANKIYLELNNLKRLKKK